jgi:iron complex transport system substrate-binding protein
MKFKLLSILSIFIFFSTTSFATKKIISIAPSNTEILIDIGLAKNLIAVDQTSKETLEVPSDITSVGLINDVNIELLLKLNPDIIIASEHNIKWDSNFLNILENLGIKVYYIPTPKNILDIISTIQLIGDITAQKEEAQFLITNFYDELEKIKKVTSNLNNKKTIYFEINPDPQIFSFGANTFLNEMIEITGGRNIFQSNIGWFFVNKEIILEKDPDIIFTNFPNQNSVVEILQRESWQNLKAIKNKKVFQIDESSLRPSHRSIKAMQQMQKLILEN